MHVCVSTVYAVYIYLGRSLSKQTAVMRQLQVNSTATPTPRMTEQ